MLEISETLERFSEQSPITGAVDGELHRVTVALENWGDERHYPSVHFYYDVYCGPVIRPDRRYTTYGPGLQPGHAFFFFHDQLKHILPFNRWSIEGPPFYTEDALYFLGWSGFWGSDANIPDRHQFVKHTNWGAINEDRPPADWIATSHEVMRKHRVMMGNRYLNQYLAENAAADMEIGPFVADYRARITRALNARLPAVADTMIHRLEEFFVKMGRAPGTVESIMRHRIGE